MRDDFRLNEWLIQPQLNTIAANGNAVRIEPKVMEVLVHLAENAGQVVSKESLMKTIWADRFVTDEVITTAIFELRRALGDDARNPRFIQTISKKGYRLIAPVVKEAGLAPQETSGPAREQLSTGSQSEPGVPAATGSHRLWLHVAAGTMIVLLAVSFILKLTAWPGRSATDSNSEEVETATKERRADAPAVSAVAIKICAEGREFLDRGSEEALKTAVACFERAIGIDPDCAQAYAGLADAYMLLEAQNHLRPEEAGPKARSAALKALQLDESLAQAHASMGLVKLSYDWDWSGAEEEFKKALALNPDYARAHSRYSQYLLAAGRNEESLREIDLARRLDPKSIAITMTAGMIYSRLGQYDQAVEEFRRAIEMDPNNSSAFKSLGYLYQKRSMFKEAEAAYKKSAELLGLPSIRRFSHNFARWSKEDNAEILLNKMSVLLKQEYIRPSYIAGLYAYFGEKERAFDWLERAYRERDGNLLFLKTDSVWDSLRADPRFISLERRIVPTS
ncbi:MAG TPA: tetratricopeptide repeat protein [Blastocatellia bacterium]|nr:tetratricopeptide repeat protein [Blastocatellia bacterium]